MFRDRPITVLVADDSAFMRTALTRMIESDPGIKVVATARDGIEAVEKVLAVQPEVVTLDVEMPRLGGLEALRQIMQKAPRPVIIVSSLTQEGAEATLNALDLGAFDCIPKQLSYACLDIVKIRQLLIDQIRAAAHMPGVTRAARPTAPLPPPDIAPLSGRPRAAIVAIGTSTGGPKALQHLLPLLPGDLPVGVVVVQHMPIGFTGPFARRLDGLCKLSVREAAQDDRV